jgi:small subunit ribosomal protein S4
MARDRGSIVKQSRREGYALHPKAHKALLKRPTKPGQHGDNVRTKQSQYSLQLREKQKTKKVYGLLEKQFSNLMKEATKTTGQSGENLLRYLELRIDNAVYRANFASSRRASRQLVNHAHFDLNGKKVDIPSIRLKVGDVISVRSKSRTNSYFKTIDQVSPETGTTTVSAWLDIDRKKMSFTVKSLPLREDAEVDIAEQLIVEYYSR